MYNFLLFFASFIAYLFLIPLAFIILIGAFILLSPLIILGIIAFLIQTILVTFIK